jgi:hypothetical protein
MNRTGSGLSIHLQDEDRKDKDSAGGRRNFQDGELDGKGCCGNAAGYVQDELRDDPSRIVVVGMPPSFRGREVRGPSCFQTPSFLHSNSLTTSINAPL